MIVFAEGDATAVTGTRDRVAGYLSINASISHHLSFPNLCNRAPPRKQISRFRTFKTTSYHPLQHQPYSSNTSRNMDSQEPNRIVIEQEKDWIRVRQNLKAVVDGLVDEHLNKPGVSENLELRKQVTRRIQKVSDRRWILKSLRILIPSSSADHGRNIQPCRPKSSD